MKALRLLPIVTLFFLICCMASCAIFGGGKKPVKLELRYPADAYINYGYSFGLKAYLIYNNGKEKEVTDKDELSVKILGAEYRYGSVIINGYPEAFSKNIISIAANYSKGDVSLSTSLDIPFNYKGDLVVSFPGAMGMYGADGPDGGQALLFRDGKDGGQGSPGGKGGNGNNLTAYIWRDAEGLYRIKVFNMVSTRTYYYKTTVTGYHVQFNVSGGPGGTGGTGGAGGPGKDGEIVNEKIKSPGDGGDGGMGGIGGDGGDGGNVYVFIHPNAADIQSRVTCNNSGGAGGNGGIGGTGGKGGAALTGQTAGSQGSSGLSGTPGYNGINGSVFQVLVEEFDIEN